MDLVLLKSGESGLWAGCLHGESPTGLCGGEVPHFQFSEDWEKLGNPGGRERWKAEVAWERPGL